MKNLLLTIISILFVSIAFGQINYTGWLIKQDSLNYALTNDTVTIETEDLDFPYRWEVYFETTPLDTAALYTNWTIMERAKRDAASPVWYIDPLYNDKDADNAAEKYSGSSLGGKTKAILYKATANKGMRVKARVHWIRAEVNYDNLVVPQP